MPSYIHYKGHPDSQKPKRVPPYPKGSCYPSFKKKDIGNLVTVKWIQSFTPLSFSERNGVIIDVVNSTGRGIGSNSNNSKYAKIRITLKRGQVSSGIFHSSFVKERTEGGKTRIYPNVQDNETQTHILGPLINSEGDREMSIQIHEFKWPDSWPNKVKIEEKDEGVICLCRGPQGDRPRFHCELTEESCSWTFNYYERDLLIIAFFGGMQLRHKIKKFNIWAKKWSLLGKASDHKMADNAVGNSIDPICVNLGITESNMYNSDKVNALWGKWSAEQRIVYSKVRGIVLSLTELESTNDFDRRSCGTYAAMVAEKRISSKISFGLNDKVVVDNERGLTVHCSPLDYIQTCRKNWKRPCETEFLLSVLFPGIAQLWNKTLANTDTDYLLRKAKACDVKTKGES